MKSSDVTQMLSDIHSSVENLRLEIKSDIQGVRDEIKEIHQEQKEKLNEHIRDHTKDDGYNMRLDRLGQSQTRWQVLQAAFTTALVTAASLMKGIVTR